METIDLISVFIDIKGIEHTVHFVFTPCALKNATRWLATGFTWLYAFSLEQQVEGMKLDMGKVRTNKPLLKPLIRKLNRNQ